MGKERCILGEKEARQVSAARHGIILHSDNEEKVFQVDFLLQSTGVSHRNGGMIANNFTNNF